MEVVDGRRLDEEAFEVDWRYHCGYLPIKLFLPNLNCAIEVFLGNWQVGMCGVNHCLDLLSNCLTSWTLSKADGGWIQRRAVDASTRGDEFNTPPEYEGQLVQPLGVNCGIET